MANKIVRYLLEGDGSVPLFIKDGGHFMINEECVGVSVDESLRHVPDTVVRLTKAELLAWITDHHKDAEDAYLNDLEGNPYTDQMMADMLDAFLEKVGMPDYE